MGGSPVPDGLPFSDSGGRLLRFDRVERAAHWANAFLFAVLLLTGIPLYFGSVERLVGRHVLLAEVHLWAGVALPFPLLVAIAGAWGARLRRDVRRFNRWTAEELQWLRSLGRRGRAADKFNPGQKLTAVFLGGAMVVLLGTGIVMRWFGPFPVSWRTGATFVHEVLAFAVTFVVAGHILVALFHPDALRAMVRGSVTRSWAEKHAPRWLDEVRGGGTGVSGAAPEPAAGPPERNRPA